MNQVAKAALGLGALGLGAWLLTRRRPVYSFAGRVVLITGGSRGLGLVLARTLVKEGARLAICARDRDELDRAADDLAGAGALPLALPCDVTRPEQVQDLMRAIEVHLGPVDVLINNAGVISVGPLSTMTRADFEEALAVSFWGAYHTVEAVLPSMRQRQEGRIVNISSIGGKLGVPHLAAYSVGKFALAGYSQALQAELADDGIVVTTVYPGLMRTGSPRHAYFKGKNEAEHTWFAISASLPGLTIGAEEAAHAIVEACRRGDAEVVLSLPAQLAVRLQALLPEVMAGLIALANRLLPSPGGIGTDRRQGKDSETALAPSALTELSDRAAERNNEIAPIEGSGTA